MVNETLVRVFAFLFFAETELVSRMTGMYFMYGTRVYTAALQLYIHSCISRYPGTAVVLYYNLVVLKCEY